MKQQACVKLSKLIPGMIAVFLFDLGFCCCATAFGGVIELRPVDSTAPGHVIRAGTIYLPPTEVAAGGVRVTFEVWIRGWGPRRLRAWQAEIDSAGYTSGSQGYLTPTTIACGTDDSICQNAFGGICSASGDPCVLDSDCSSLPVPQTCRGPACHSNPYTPFDGFCEPGFIQWSRHDFVFRGVPGGAVGAVDLSTPGFRYAAATNLGPGKLDAGVSRYAGTLELSVSPNAEGTFSIRFRASPYSKLIDENNLFYEAALYGAFIKIEDPPVVGACCWSDPLYGSGCNVTTRSLCEFPPPTHPVAFGTYKGDGTSCLGDSDGNGVDDACSICGDGNREGLELCDGADTGSFCALGCLADCTCMTLSPGSVRWFSMDGMSTGQPFS